MYFRHIRANLLSVFLPTIVFSIGEGAIIPMIPAIAAAVGADLATAGLEAPWV